MPLSTNTLARVALVHSLTQRARARGERGLKGKDADPREVERLVTERVAAIPKPKNGRDVDMREVERILTARVAELPKPKNGADADMNAVMLRVDAFLRGIVVEKGDKGDKGKDGVGIELITFPGSDILITLTDGRAYRHRIQRRGGSSGQPAIIVDDSPVPIKVRTSAVSTAVEPDDDVLLISAAGAVEVTLQAAADAADRERPLHIKRIGTGEVTVQGAETIDGDPYKIINTRYTSLMLASTGSEWVVI